MRGNPSCSRRTPSSPPDRRCPESGRVDKGFQQQHAMTESRLPIAGQTPLAQRQNPRPQIAHRLRQDEKAAVVDHQLQAAIALTEVPADPAIPPRALEGGGGKAQQRYPFLPPGGDIPERFADLRQSPQVVVLLHQFLIPGLIAGQNRPHHDLTQVQARLPRRSTPQTFYVLQPGAYNTPQGVVPEQVTTA